MAFPLENILVLAGPELQAICLFFVDRFQWEFLLVVLEESTELEVVLGIEVRFHCHVVLNELQEFLLKFVDLLGYEERIDKGEICVGQVAIIPDLLGYQKGAKDKWTPVGWLQGHLSEGNESVYVNQTYNAALRAKTKSENDPIIT